MPKTDRRAIRGPIHQALEPVVREHPRITPEGALERLESSHGDLLRNYSHPLSAVRRALRDLRR